MKKHVTLLAILIAAVSILQAGDKWRFTDRTSSVPYQERDGVAPPSTRTSPWLSSARGASLSVGTYTTLQGWYDYQSNGGVNQYIRVDSTTGAIHVVYMMAEDSASSNTSRRTAYAVSTDDGATWNNFNNVRVPGIRSGFPSLDLLSGVPSGQVPLVANHNVGGGAVNASWVYIGDNTGTFTELSPLPPSGSGGANEPIWPFVASGSNGEIVVTSSVDLTPVPSFENYVTRTTDFGTTWDSWTLLPITQGSGGRNPLAADGAGRMGMIINTDTTTWFESTNNGQTWNSTVVYPPLRYVGAETLGMWVGVDAVYLNHQPIVTLNTSRTSDGASFFYAGSRIEIWSPSIGIKTAVPWDSLLYPSSAVAQVNHLSVGYPAIGVSGDRLVIAYQAFLNDERTRDTLSSGRYFGEIFLTMSTDGGSTWVPPLNITNTPQLDERYPSIAKWSPDGYAYIVWQEDTRAGSHAFNDNAPISRSSQVFFKANLNTIFPVNDLTAVGIEVPPPGGAVKQGSSLQPQATFRNLGLAAQTGAPVRFEVLNGLGAVVYTSNQTIPSIAPGATARVTFDSIPGSLAVGRYATRAIARLGGDQQSSNDTATSSMNVVPVIAVTGTYVENFEDPAPGESGGYGWYAAIASGAGEPDWVRGTPAKTQIAAAHGGTKCFVTKLTGLYTAGVESFLGSPVFDFSALTGDIQVEFWQNFQMEPKWDTGWLQYSTDGGITWMIADHTLGTGPTFNTPTSTYWYNENEDSSATVYAPPTWSGSSTLYSGHTGGWIRSTTVLPVGGLSDVRLRWYFAPDGSLDYEGWAIDDVTLAAGGTSVSGDETGLPAEYVLLQNYPNPANPSTQFTFGLPEAGQVSLVVYDVLGRKVTEVVNRHYNSGYHTATWSGTDSRGEAVASGAYVARFSVSDELGKVVYAKVNKLVVMK